MKIQILTQNIKDNLGMIKGLTDAQSILKKLGLDVSLSYKEVSKKFTSVPVSSDVVSSGYIVNHNDIISVTNKGYDLSCLIYESSIIYPRPTNPVTVWVNDSISMQIPVNWYSDFNVTPNITYTEVLTQYFLHEFCHVMYALTKKSDLTHAQHLDKDYSQKQPIEYYKYLISGLIPFYVKKPEMKKYKYFTDKEIIGLTPELVSFLDIARGIAGVPFIISSGFRTKEVNKMVGGVVNSAHTKGLAVDLRIKDNATRFALMKGLINAGTPCFIEDAKGHIHVDIDSKIHPMNVIMWSSDD